MRLVTDSEWADYLVDKKVYARQAEPYVRSDIDRLQHVEIIGYDLQQNPIGGEVLGEVRYHSITQKSYFIK